MTSIKRLDCLINKYPHWHRSESMNFLLRMKKKSSNCKRLEDLCLYSIVQNFDVIMKEYFKNEEENYKKLKFINLKRWYSKTLFESLLLLRKNSAMDEPQVTFLVNRYIRDLDLSGCVFDSISGLVTALKLVGRTIFSINLSGMVLKMSVINLLLSFLPNLEAIHLNFVKTKSRSLKVIREKCPQIKTLSLSRMELVTDDSLRLLCSLSETNNLKANPNIETLDLTGTHVSSGGIMFALKYFPSLKILRHRYVAKALHLLHYEGLVSDNLKNLPKYCLEEINIYSDLHIAEILQICVTLCPHLTSITVNNISSPLEMDICLNFPHLKDVQLFFDIDLNVNCSEKFFDLQKYSLEKLHIASAQISITALSRCQKLQKLNLTRPVFNNFDESLKPSPNIFPRLTDLEISGVNLSDKNNLNCFLFIMSSCPILKKLTVRDIDPFPDHVMDSVLQFSFVTELLEVDIRYCTITIAAIDRILLVPMLKKVVISGCGIPKSTQKRILDTFSSSGRTAILI